MNFSCQHKLEPTFQMLALVLAAALLFSPAICQETKTTCYCIKPDNDTSKSECFPLSHYVGDHTVIHNDSYFCFLPGEYYLDGVWQILPNSTLYNIGLVASCSNVSEHKAVASVRCIGNHSGIVVKNVAGLTIAGLSFTSCGHIFKVVETISSSLLLIFVEDLSMSGVEIHDSNGWGMYCFSLLGNSTITYTLISSGHYITNHSGGNLRFKYVGDCVYSHVSSISISDSIIENGAENCTDSNAYAGGIDIYFITRNRINMYFNNVTFHNNSGYDGGNVAVSYSTLGDGWNSTLTFTKCTISAGYAAHDGGGLYMEVIKKKKVSRLPALPVEVPNSVILTVVETNFTSNYAKSEGAGLFLQIHEDQDLTITAELHFFSCEFANNIAKSSQSGTAVHIVNINLPESVPHRVPQYYISFDECSFEDNGGQNWDIENLLGCGTMYVAENAITVIKNSRILNNNCSGLVAVQSSILMNGSILIADNQGYNGAGIMLCANSKLFVTKEANITIQENHAFNFGGGIYAEFQCSQAVPPCFYGTEDNDTLVYLVNNNASRAGDALYGGSVDSCYTSPNSFLVDGKSSVSFDTLFEITQFNPTKSKITSDPYKVCLCNNSYYNQSNCVTTYNYRDSALYPGMVIHVYVVLAGQRNGTVPGVVKASFENNQNINSSQKTQLVKSTENCTKLEYDISQYQSDQHYNDTLYLSVENAYYRTRSPNQLFHSTVNLSISRCPLGFSLSNSRCTCSNVLRQNLKRIICNIEDQTATRDINVDWWLGFQEGIVIYSTFCPFDFCQNLKKVNISFKNGSDHDKQCAFDRSGKLCGACPTNHSNIFGSSWCWDCRSHSPLKTFALTVLIGFAGILLLVCLGILNLNVTEGPLNPIIFYMNVIRLNDSVFFGYGGNRVHYLLRVFVAWVNLDLGKDTCYYNGMGAIGRSSLQFVFPFYLWFLCGLFIYLSRHSSLLSRITGKRSVKLLATVILLSYTKILKTVIDIVWPSTISEIKDNHVVHHQTVWQMDGTFYYFHHHHRILFIFAAIVAVGTLPYTLSLFFIQCLNKMSHYKILFWVVKLKPFFDAYTGPYKDNYHFWTGFLLVVRFFLFIAIACNTAKGPMLNLTLVCSIAAALLILSQCGVYKVRILCFLESFVYFNLILFSIGTAYVIQEKSATKAFYYSNNKAVLVCVGSMFLLFCGIVAYNIKTILIQTRCWRNLKVWLLERQCVRRKKTPIKSLVLQHSVYDSSSSSGDDEMDPILENAPPVARYDQFREPLVETN